MWVAFDAGPVDLVVLDVMLPGTNGIDLCRQIRRKSDVPIIFISAKGSETDRIVGLELGADDYLPKPFGTRELIARIRAILRRVGVERGRRFIGRSQIVAPSGKILAEAGAVDETILYTDIDLVEARQKRIVIEPGEWELDVIGGRRPDLYGRLAAE